MPVRKINLLDVKQDRNEGKHLQPTLPTTTPQKKHLNQVDQRRPPQHPQQLHQRQVQQTQTPTQRHQTPNQQHGSQTKQPQTTQTNLLEQNQTKHHQDRIHEKCQGKNQARTTVQRKCNSHPIQQRNKRH